MADYAKLAHELAVELATTRESLAIHRSASESAREFLLKLHRSGATLDVTIQAELDDLLRRMLNLGGQRPIGRAGQRSRLEKTTIVREYDAALMAGYGSAAAVCRKYGTSPTSIIRWRALLDEPASTAREPEWLGGSVDPLVRALAGKKTVALRRRRL